jgi:hypothetical protein
VLLAREIKDTQRVEYSIFSECPLCRLNVTKLFAQVELPFKSPERLRSEVKDRPPRRQNVYTMFTPDKKIALREG